MFILVLGYSILCSFLFSGFLFDNDDHLEPAVCRHLWSRDDHHPADDERHGQVPRHAQQCQGIHETTRGKLYAYCLLYSVPYVYTVIVPGNTMAFLNIFTK